MTQQTLTPLKPAGTIDTIFELDCVYDKDQRQVAVDYTTAKKIPWAIKHKRRPGRVAIVASGPSASDYADFLKEFDGEIWGINGALAWLIHRGIKPTGFVGLDPEPLLKEYLIETPDYVTYYLAAQVHPEVFEHLEGKNVKLWFAADGQVTLPFGAVEVFGGTTCLTRAPNLAYHLGYREVHIFGCDSSYTHKSHVYGEALLPAGTFSTEVDGEVFLTTRQMLQQACDFAEQMVEWARPGDDGGEPLSVSLYGEGLLQSMYAHTLKRGGYHQYLREAYKDGLSRKQRRALRKVA
jgi:uncharacterized Rossmann fold enzyme